MLDRFVSFFRSIHPQKYVNALIVFIGLVADIISLGLFFGAMSTPTSGSNFYVNSREFLAWVLIAIVYSIGLLNALFRRRWHKLYGNDQADHSIFNIFAKFEDTFRKEEEIQLRFRNFQRDFSFLYVEMFPVTFLYSRAVTAAANATGITSSPWGDVFLSSLIAIPVTLFMMIITSMFDFALSIFVGDQNLEDSKIDG